MDEGISTSGSQRLVLPVLIHGIHPRLGDALLLTQLHDELKLSKGQAVIMHLSDTVRRVHLLHLAAHHVLLRGCGHAF